jgi:hypothetical protein
MLKKARGLYHEKSQLETKKVRQSHQKVTEVYLSGCTLGDVLLVLGHKKD